MGDFLRQLEEASNIIMAPPHTVNQEQRQAAEHTILAFRRASNPLQACQFILEHSNVDYILFQAASTVKEAVIRDWALLDHSQVDSVRSFLLKFVTHKPGLPSYVREQILQAVAVIFKRGTVESKEAGREGLFSDISQLIASGDPTMQTIACSMLTALLNEYSGSTRTSDIGLSWEFHIQCKRIFEAHDLKKVFLFALQIMQQLMSTEGPLSGARGSVFSRFLNICEQVLSWEFMLIRPARRRVGSFQPVDTPPLKPDSKWRDPLLEHGLLDLFFKIHSRTRLNPDLCHHAMQCLSQLATLDGPVFANDKAKSEYLTHFVRSLLQCLNSSEVQDHEALGFANIINHLITKFPIELLAGLPSALLSSFVTTLTTFTCLCGRQAALEEALHQDDQQYMEAFDQLLECWTSLLRQADRFPPAYFCSHAIQVFNCYLQSHLGAPDGTRDEKQNGDACEDDEEEDEINELEEDDRDLFGDQLISVAAMGRATPQHSIPLLTKLLEDRATRLQSHLQRHQHHTHHNVDIDIKGLHLLYEDLHWLILITGHLLADDYRGETPVIPEQIIRHSLQESQRVDADVTLKVLGSVHEDAASIPGLEKADQIVRLSAAVFRISEIERRAVQANLADLWSPQVGSTTVWFLRRWLSSYLMLNESYYNEISVPLAVCFGKGTEGSHWLTSFLLDKCLSNLSIWSSEHELANDTVDLLVSLVEKKERCLPALQCESFWTIAKQHAASAPPLDLLPLDIKSNLMKALVLAGCLAPNAETKDRFAQEVLIPVQNRYKGLIQQEEFVRKAQEDTVKTTLCMLLSLLRGIVMGTRFVAANELFLFIWPLATECVALVRTYHHCSEVVELVLELYLEMGRRQLTYINKVNSFKLYEMSLSLLETYKQCNLGKRRRDAIAEEEQYHDISVMIELLTEIISKDMTDFLHDDEPNPVNNVSAPDVVLYGLNILLPLINHELLRFPNLCQQYFRLVTSIGELYPERLVCLPGSLFQNLMASIEAGLVDYGGDVSKMSLDALSSMAEHCAKNPQEVAGSQLSHAMVHFLKVLFDTIVRQSFDMDIIASAGGAFYTLICSHHEKYTELVNNVLRHQSNPSHYQRLAAAFSQLTPSDSTLQLDRAHKMKFQGQLETFLLNVRPFLIVK
ncbi:exportin-4-like [Diadema antillarum]|uniref:exportin-4-like n=2 Tax=Diadema antillarum TaxID=105358 RepID=UPI003A86E28F